jgi:hypothetical protein
MHILGNLISKQPDIFDEQISFADHIFVYKNFLYCRILTKWYIMQLDDDEPTLFIFIDYNDFGKKKIVPSLEKLIMPLYKYGRISPLF